MFKLVRFQICKIGDIIKSNDITFNVNVSSNLRLVNKEIKFINSDKKSFL